MMEPTWGLLGPEFLPSSRRTRTLDVGAAVRAFNDLAVPGLGGAWFGKQIVLALLGVEVANQAGAHNMEVANAIEALACWLAFNSSGWTPDARLRGQRKLRTRKDLGFKVVRRSNFYVTQPMRRATVQTLPALGLVESAGFRFNGFKCTDAGRDLIAEATRGFSPFKRKLVDHLVLWVRGEEDRVNSSALNDALSPTKPLTGSAREILKDRLIRGTANESDDSRDRRQDALRWVESCRRADTTQSSWTMRPAAISSDQHWLDLRAGALFFRFRTLALALLDALEAQMPADRKLSLDAGLPDRVSVPLGELRQSARAFLELRHDNDQAKRFCAECAIADPILILTKLVARDGRVLRLAGSQILPGPAFVGSAVPVLDDDADPNTAPVVDVEGFSWPDGISERIPNLFLLNVDLHGELDSYLRKSINEGDQ